MKACGCLTAVSYSFEPDWPFASLSSSFVRYHLCCKGFSTNHCRWCVWFLFSWILSGHVQGNICKSMVSKWTYFDLWPLTSTGHFPLYNTHWIFALTVHSSLSTTNYHVHYIQSLLPHSDAHFELQQLIFTMSHMPIADSSAIVLKSNQPPGRLRPFVGTLLTFFLSHPKEILLNFLICPLSVSMSVLPVLFSIVWFFFKVSLHLVPCARNEGWYQLHPKFVLQYREVILFLCFLLLILSFFYCPQYCTFPPCKWFFLLNLFLP